ncbi:MAG TPA: hypothetical protein VH682_15410 [Gemmataceae bacterium]|jgi:hypothetical protein
MTRTVVGFLGLLALLLALLPALQAWDDAETPTLAQRYKQLAKEYDTARMTFMKT